MQLATPIAATTQSASTFQDFLRSVSQLGLDVARHKLLDVERVSDDANIPDQADLQGGFLGQPAVGGLTLGATLLVVGVVVAAGFLLARLVK